MADENLLASPNETTVFRIGGRDLKVPPLTLWDLEISADEIAEMKPNTRWSRYATLVVSVVVRQLNPDRPEIWDELTKSMAKSCSVAEARALSRTFDDLLSNSGFVAPGEEEAATPSDGTGTSTESLPNSPSPLDASTSDSSSEP